MSMNDVTLILQAIQQGDRAASKQLLPLVYDELRRLARSKMVNEPAGQTLQPTALVHEAYVRLVDAKSKQTWNSKGHFFGAAANAMRRILIDNARKKKSLRRGGEKQRVDIEAMDLSDPNDPSLLVALDESLTRLSQSNPDIAQVVSLRYFAGLTIEETSEALGISVRTVNRHWSFAKAWLYAELTEDDGSNVSSSNNQIRQ